MRKVKKKSILKATGKLIGIVVLGGILGSPALARPYVNDETHLFSEKSIAEATQRMRETYNRTHRTFYVHTVPEIVVSLQADAKEDYKEAQVHGIELYVVPKKNQDIVVGSQAMSLGNTLEAIKHDFEIGVKSGNPDKGLALATNTASRILFERSNGTIDTEPIIKNQSRPNLNLRNQLQNTTEMPKKRKENDWGFGIFICLGILITIFLLKEINKQKKRKEVYQFNDKTQEKGAALNDPFEKTKNDLNERFGVKNETETPNLPENFVSIPTSIPIQGYPVAGYPLGGGPMVVGEERKDKHLNDTKPKKSL